jgi:uncharacterized membrane protein
MKRKTNPAKHAALYQAPNPSMPPPIVQKLMVAEIERQVQLKIQQLTVESTYSGPLPPADETVKMEQAFPGFINRWTAMAEKEQEARHGTINRRDTFEFVYRMAALLMGFLLCGSFLAGGFYLLLQGNAGAGFTSISMGLAQIIGAVYMNRKKPS